MVYISGLTNFLLTLSLPPALRLPCYNKVIFFFSTSYFQALFSEDSWTALGPHTSIFLLWNPEWAKETRWEMIMLFLPGLETLPVSFFKNKEIYRCCSTNLEHLVLCERFSQLSHTLKPWVWDFSHPKGLLSTVTQLQQLSRVPFRERLGLEQST